MEHFDASHSTYFRALLGPRDTRVKGWFLLDNYIPTFVCSVIYLLIVWLGPKYMKNKQPFSCRRILVVYNIGLTLLSLYMFYERFVEKRMGQMVNCGGDLLAPTEWGYISEVKKRRKSLDKLTVCASDEGLLDSLRSEAQLFPWQC
ncbi:hypothetical protein U0070_026842, partial [Myodes glareolus]